MGPLAPCLSGANSDWALGQKSCAFGQVDAVDAPGAELARPFTDHVGPMIMQFRPISRALRCLATACALAAVSGASYAGEPVPVAVLDFDYIGRSGGLLEQGPAKTERLRKLVQQLRDGLAQSGLYRVVSLNCEPAPCSAIRHDPGELIAKARAAGVRLLVFGGIQKMNAIVQYGNAEAVDLEADRLVFDRNVVFRDDSEEAWDYAAKFLVAELTKESLGNSEASIR
jgi:hypothetical protein